MKRNIYSKKSKKVILCKSIKKIKSTNKKQKNKLTKFKNKPQTAH